MRGRVFFWPGAALALLLGLSIPFRVAWAEDRRTDTRHLVIMTLNAEFLWDGVAPEEGQVDFPWKHSQTEAEDHMREVADLIIQSDPDIVNLVEVENLQALTALNTGFLAGRGYRPYLADGRDTYTGQDVGLLTRIDPENDQIQRDDRLGHSGDVSKSVSKNYYAKLRVGGTRLGLIGVHFLARPLSESRRLAREAQADAIRALGLDLLGQGYKLVVLGDFNDYDGESDSRDHIQSMPVTNVLQVVRGMAPANPDDDLINAAQFAPQAERYTGFWDANRKDRVDAPNEFTSIDHVLLSPELEAQVDVVRVPHSHDPLSVTDHFPVVVRFRLGDGLGPGGLRISRLVPNPEGEDRINEEATIRNTGAQPVDLHDWQLRDIAGRTWSLDALGTISPGGEKTIKRHGQAMAMNNDGDTIDLLDPTGAVVDSVSYGEVEEGEAVIATI